MRATAVALAKEDVADLYRRTLLGPFWLLVSYVVFVGSLVWVIGHGAGIDNYLGFVACGLLVYTYISEVMGESVGLFEREQAFIKGSTLPISIYVMRLTSRTLLRNIFPLLAMFGFVIYSGVAPTTVWFYGFLGIFLIIVTTPAAATLFAVVGAIMPDMSFIVSNLLRVAFFLSPVFWDHANDPIRQFFFYWNPFTYFIEIVRAPLLAGDPAMQFWTVALCISAGLWVSAVLALGAYRDRIVFLV